MSKALKPKEREFIVEYLSNGNNGSAAVKKVYNPVSDNAARHKASILLSNVNIRETLDGTIPDDFLKKVHMDLLTASRIDHLIFPLGPKKTEEKLPGQDILSDEEIKDLLAEVNCKLRKVVHGETARHVYFWSADNMARDKALDKAYKLKGTYAPEKKELSGSIEVIDDERVSELSNKLLNAQQTD